MKTSAHSVRGLVFFIGMDTHHFMYVQIDIHTINSKLNYNYKILNCIIKNFFTLNDYIKAVSGKNSNITQILLNS